MELILEGQINARFNLIFLLFE